MYLKYKNNCLKVKIRILRFNFQIVFQFSAYSLVLAEFAKSFSAFFPLVFFHRLRIKLVGLSA